MSGLRPLFSPVWILIFSISQANAQEAIHISFEDIDGDGGQDIASMDVNFTDWRGDVVSKGRVLVYDEDDDMRVSQDWRICCDFDNDVWVFDADGSGDAQLIIDFNSRAGNLEALLYDDSSGDKRVSYSYDAEKFELTETKFPTLRVIAEGDSWMVNGNLAAKRIYVSPVQQLSATERIKIGSNEESFKSCAITGADNVIFGLFHSKRDI